MIVKRSSHDALLSHRIAVVEPQVVEIEELTFLAPISQPRSNQILVLVRRVEVGGIGYDGLDPESIVVPFLTLAEHFYAVKRPTGVGPFQGRDQSLRAVEQLLTSATHVNRLALILEEF